MDAAPITAEVPDLQQTSLKGDKKPTDLWMSGPDIHDTTMYIDRQEITVPVKSSGSLDKAISSRHFLDKIFAATNSQDRTLNTAHESDRLENILAATSQLSPDPVIDQPAIDHTPVEDSSAHETLKLTSATANSNKQSKGRSARLNSAASSSSEDRRQKMLHMLSALEELHRSFNNSLNSRLTILTRGNSNSRGPGKKSKMITDGTMKSTTASSVVSKGASPKSSTDQVDPKLLNGKALKKSLPSTPKKTNKRGDLKLKSDCINNITYKKVFQFLNAKCESAFLTKRNPRQINWTVLYRRKHKKGQSEEVTKKRTRRTVKFQRAITGASLAEILAKRNQKPEVRKAQREQAIRAAKEAKKAKQAAKKVTTKSTKAPAKAAPKQKIAKPMKVNAPRVGGKR
ncbi:60S ribosomal protein L24 [Bagarius yarrelli]|uniref:Large ribosomal subunit protein eL24 n=1 Tax=Bagarius yarrelli TaxID=175774 RepID=A0A556TKH8_BAGYA|nr:60S ribosomal protein L24 [Bagarius yarrelli]